jgi:hypothetical protein
MSIVPTAPGETKSKTWLWSGLAGAAIGLTIGATVASGIFWLVMRERERRIYAQLADRGIGLAADAWNTGITQAGNLLSGGSSGSNNETTPTKDEIADYLDGKTLSLPEAGSAILNPGEKSSKSCIIKKDGVQAVEKESGGWRVGDEAWNTSILILYDVGDARYAVDATIQHKPLGGKSAFFGFAVKRVAEQ